MHRDSIFYKLFSQFPDLLFELMPDPPPHEIGYQFEFLASRRLEPSNAHLHRALLDGPQVQQIYLDELAASEQTSLGIQLIQLTMTTEATAIQQARYLLAQVPQHVSPEQSEQP